jgi:hypothetical protein
MIYDPAEALPTGPVIDKSELAVDGRSKQASAIGIRAVGTSIIEPEYR